MCLANALLWRSWAAELSCCWWAAELSCCWWAAEQSAPRGGCWSAGRRPLAGFRPLVHAQVTAGEAELGFGLADAFIDYERAVAGVEAVDRKVGSAVA
jgi:hypothetical protein